MQPVTWYTARPLLDLMLALQGLEAPVLDPAEAWRVFKEYLAVPSEAGSVVGGFHCSVVSDESLGPGVLVRFVREISDPEVGGSRVRNVFLQLVYNESQEGLEDRDLSMEDYVGLGVFDALAAVQRALPRAKVHAMGYCLGGTLLAIAAAAMARDDHAPIKTLTLLAAQTDFEDPGELGLFIDESQVAFLEDLMSERGVLDGRQMAGAFALINSKDLVWSKLVHEYLMGATTPLTDLRAWNADATRMPARMHGEYLRGLYLNNDLAEGRYLVGGRPVALHDMHWPMYVVATERDHVSPWQSVYKIQLLTDAELRFVLTRGGHNVGIVNPPAGPAASPAAGYRVGMRALGAPYQNAQTWFEGAAEHTGSWWTDWTQ